ncbi:MAG: inositol monophosphatase family protein [Spirochaetia bacterium]
MSAMNVAQRREYLDFAREIAREAGQVTLAYFRRDLETETKADRTPVTIADRESETLLRRRIRSRYPNHGILGEEEGLTAGRDDLTWVLDPIDGTKSFVLGVGQYAVLVALVSSRYTGEGPLPASAVEVGIIYVPPLDEMVSAARGLGATWHNGVHEAPARVSGIDSLKTARIGTTDFADLARREPSIFAGIVESGAMTRTWGDAYGYMLVATGRYEVMIDPIMNPWDIGPLPVIIAEAGGRFTDLSGDGGLGASGIASNGVLHDELLALRR